MEATLSGRVVQDTGNLTKQFESNGRMNTWIERSITLQYANQQEKYPLASYVTIVIPQRLVTVESFQAIKIGDHVTLRCAVGAKKTYRNKEGHEVAFNKVTAMERLQTRSHDENLYNHNEQRKQDFQQAAQNQFAAGNTPQQLSQSSGGQYEAGFPPPKGELSQDADPQDLPF